MEQHDIERLMDTKLHACRATLAEEFHKIILEAFPKDEDGTVDLTGHKQYHEAKIKAAKAEAEFWQELRIEIAKKGAVGLLVVIVGLLLVGLQVKIGLPINRIIP